MCLFLWAGRDKFDLGEWSFFSPCTENGQFTSSVYTDAAKPCRQRLTTNSKIGAHGTSLTVGPSYQLSYASLPFRAVGKLGGLTLRKQFEAAFEENAKGLSATAATRSRLLLAVPRVPAPWDWL